MVSLNERSASTDVAKKRKKKSTFKENFALSTNLQRNLDKPFVYHESKEVRK